MIKRNCNYALGIRFEWMDASGSCIVAGFNFSIGQGMPGKPHQ